MKMMILTVCFLCCLTQLVTGCVFNANDPQGFYSKKSRKNTIRNKETMFRKLHPEFSNDVFRMNLQLAAGPFDIENAIVNETTSYNHKKHGSDWSATYSQCGGANQSPIDIIKADAAGADLPKLRFDRYTKIHPRMNIVNNGHTVDIVGPWGKSGMDLPRISGGPLTGVYQLAGTHFHWGNNRSQGSEHTMNGVPGAMEMHFVHYNIKYPNVTAAIASNDPEGLAVVGLIFEVARATTKEARPIFTTLQQAIAGEIIFPAHYPLDLITYGHSYFTYRGSLTTPVCSESVRWIVVEKLLDISYKHLSVLMKFKKNGTPIKGNYRETQPLNGRLVTRHT